MDAVAVIEALAALEALAASGAPIVIRGSRDAEVGVIVAIGEADYGFGAEAEESGQVVLTTAAEIVAAAAALA